MIRAFEGGAVDRFAPKGIRMKSLHVGLGVAFSLLLISCGGFTPIGDGENEGGEGGGEDTGGSAGTGASAGTGNTSSGGSGNTSSGGSGNTSSGGSGNTSSGGSGNTSSGGSGNASSGGSGNAGGSGGTGGTLACETFEDCQLIGAPCSQCADGSFACPTAECIDSQCVTSFPTCTDVQCDDVSDCPVSLAPCTLCADGSSACPWADCVNGACVNGFDMCPGTDPCAGKACGEACSLCDGPDCESPSTVLGYCDANLECQPNEPVCEANVCETEEDCPEADFCSQCPNSQACADRACVDGQCQFTCPPVECDDCTGDQVCIYQVGGPGPSRYTCADQVVCGAPGACACILNQGTCQMDPVDGYCQCDNGLE